MCIAFPCFYVFIQSKLDNKDSLSTVAGCAAQCNSKGILLYLPPVDVHDNFFVYELNELIFLAEGL